jgi:hypothetical protein
MPGSRLILASALFLLAAIGRSAAPSDYQAWSMRPRPGERVQFEFGRPYLIASLKTGGSGLYAPNAFRASNGGIFLGYYTYSDGLDFVDPFPAALLKSDDSGITWYSLGERGNNGFFFGETRDKTVLAVDCMWHDHGDAGRYYAAEEFVSTGYEKPALAKISVRGFGPGQEPYFHMNRMVRAADGSLVSVLYTPSEGLTHSFWYGGPERFPNSSRILCLASTDEGSNWQLRSELTSNGRLSRSLGRAADVSEPYVEALPDGRLLCIFRLATGRDVNSLHLDSLMRCWSSDSGRTWTSPVAIGVIGVDPCLLQMKNGVLLCSFGRPDVRLMYSVDGGTVWQGFTTVYRYASKAPEWIAHLADRGRPGRPGEADKTVFPFSHAYTSMVALSADRMLYFFDIHQHEVPWSGLLPSEPAAPLERSNSIFAFWVKIVRAQP